MATKLNNIPKIIRNYDFFAKIKTFDKMFDISFASVMIMEQRENCICVGRVCTNVGVGRICWEKAVRKST